MFRLSHCSAIVVSQETLLLFCLATPVQCYCGRRFHRAARRALQRRAPNMDVLISTATCLAYGTWDSMVSQGKLVENGGECQCFGKKW